MQLMMKLEQLVRVIMPKLGGELLCSLRPAIIRAIKQNHQANQARPTNIIIIRRDST